VIAGNRLSYRLSLLVLVLTFSLRLAAAEQGQLDASEALFTTLAAANTAGYDAGLGTSPEIRNQIRERIAAANAPVVAELKAWYKEHPVRDKTADLSRFISLGLSIKGAPDFAWSKRDVEVPPEKLAAKATIPRSFIAGMGNPNPLSTLRDVIVFPTILSPTSAINRFELTVKIPSPPSKRPVKAIVPALLITGI
jgi:hypothetical protein